MRHKCGSFRQKQSRRVIQPVVDFADCVIYGRHVKAGE